MGRYDGLSREELIHWIEELESERHSNPDPAKRRLSAGAGWFREKFADQILDSIPDMLTVFNRKGEIVDLVSSEETNHAGVPVTQLFGCRPIDLLDAEGARNLTENLNNVFASGHWSASGHSITIKGNRRQYENRIFPLDNEHALCMCRDITEEQLTKQELETVRYAMNRVDEEIYACDLDGCMIYANERFRSRHRIVDEISEHKVYEFWIPAGTARLWQNRLQRIRDENGTYKYTVRFKDDRGNIVAWDVVAYIMYDELRKKDVVWFFGRDVTLRILQESKLKEINSVMNSILNNVPVYLFVKDPGNEFRYLYWNRAFEEYSHIPASKALGHTDFEVFPNPRDAEKFREDDMRLLRNGERISYLEEYVTQTGQTRIVTTSKALVSMENRLPLIIGVSWDVTEQKSAEAEIIEARIKAEQSDRLKSAFLANMSHEIRTPLNAIVGFSQLIGEAESEEEKQQYAEIIDSNAELLLQLINDILDISKIEAGTLEFKFRRMDLNELCRSQYEVFRTRVGKNVKLIFEEKYEKIEFICDQNRLSQVVANLLTNAVKFTQQGEIRFGFDICGQMIEFYVKDTGVGIAEDKLDHIFGRFVKLNNFAVGTGLGLSISQMIVEKIGGQITVESEEGQGSCFRFTVPYMQSMEGVDEEEVSAQRETSSTMPMLDSSNPWKVLVAEDIESNYMLIQTLLGRRFQLIRARNGEEAVALFHSESPDVVLMDVKMPLMDGYEATRQIRLESADVPIIAMTAFAADQDRESALQAGCSDYITKPLSFAELNKKLNACLVASQHDEKH